MCSHYQTLKEFDKLRRLYPGLMEPDDAWRPDTQKRMFLILPEGAYEAWFDTRQEETRDFLVQYPAERLVATPAAKQE